MCPAPTPSTPTGSAKSPRHFLTYSRPTTPTIFSPPWMRLAAGSIRTPRQSHKGAGMHRSRLAGFIIDCNTDDLERAAQFWSAALGYELKAKSEEPSPLYRCMLTD